MNGYEEVVKNRLAIAWSIAGGLVIGGLANASLFPDAMVRKNELGPIPFVLLIGIVADRGA